jgi:hypothetical protein
MPDKWINWALVKEPLNWAVIMVTATIWLLAFHTIMKGFSAMQGQSAFSPGPGLTSVPNATASFSQPGVTGTGSNLSSWWGGGLKAGDGTWTDSYDAQFAQDGWDGNP